MDSGSVISGGCAGGGCAGDDTMVVGVVRGDMLCRCESISGGSWSVKRGASISFGSRHVISDGRAGGRCVGGVMTVEVMRSSMPCGCKGVSGRLVARGACINIGSGVMAEMGRSRMPLGRLPRQVPERKSVVPHRAGCDGLLIHKAHDWSNEGTGKGGRHVLVCGVVDGTDGS